MSWFFSNINAESDRKRASAAEIVACFSRERPMLARLALLITGEPAAAGQCIADACDQTVAASHPFQDWLVEWAKAATITCAISRSAETIRHCQVTSQAQRWADHPGLADDDDQGRAEALHTILQVDPDEILGELDALSRAVLVLRVAIRASIQDCVLRLNVSRSAVLAAQDRALCWLHSVPARPSSSRNSSGEKEPAKRPK
ncbi:MAG: hypothetical protein JST79_07620 [Acidobacteria bacterium]|jgi:hypothetical protein|nr:hypothetical protein [Acidobacteriota bacterium]